MRNHTSTKWWSKCDDRIFMRKWGQIKAFYHNPCGDISWNVSIEKTGWKINFSTLGASHWKKVYFCAQFFNTKVINQKEGEKLIATQITKPGPRRPLPNNNKKKEAAHRINPGIRIYQQNTKTPLSTAATLRKGRFSSRMRRLKLTGWSKLNTTWAEVTLSSTAQ